MKAVNTIEASRGALLLLLLLFLHSALSFQTVRMRPTPFTTSSSRTTILHSTPTTDHDFMNLAVEYAQRGLGHTFPNPAVGCVLVNSITNEIVGRGFHPRAGYPHAEAFALLQATGHVEDGVAAAQIVLDHCANNNVSQQHPSDEFKRIQQLSEQYRKDAKSVVHASLSSETCSVTAYVTLEPCCHTGKTPPCAFSLVYAGVQRVVVGFRDPNPRVAGGGIDVLQTHGIEVELVEHPPCADLVTAFCRRITPRPDEWPVDTYNEQMTGAMRSALRSVAGRQKAAGTLPEVSWAKDMKMDVEQLLQQQDDDLDNLITLYKSVPVKPEWMEHLDQLLWDHELVLVRLNNVVGKKKDAKVVGEVIAAQLQAHVAQTVGHTCMLYRPAVPPVLNLEHLVSEAATASSTSSKIEQ